MLLAGREKSSNLWRSPPGGCTKRPALSTEIYIHTPYTYSYICADIHIKLHINMCTITKTYTHMYVCIYVYIYIYIYGRTRNRCKPRCMEPSDLRAYFGGEKDTKLG